jgi:hypothetical protein
MPVRGRRPYVRRGESNQLAAATPIEAHAAPHDEMSSALVALTDWRERRAEVASPMSRRRGASTTYPIVPAGTSLAMDGGA